MRIANKPSDAVLSLDGKAKVNKRVVGVWFRRYSNEDEKNLYFFSLAEGNEPVVVEYFRHEFRASIANYCSKHGIIGTQPEKPEKRLDMSEDERKRRSTGAKFSHIKRSLLKREPLSEKTLKLALEVVNVQGDSEFSKFVRSIGSKMKNGEALNDYETHIMVDILLN